jgi:sigma-E factor negative regulatory protein RseC
MAGQKVELGIAEGSLLGSAMLVYMAPLVGLFVMAAFSRCCLPPIWPLCGAHWAAWGDSGCRGLSPSLPRASRGSRSFSALGCRQISFVSKRSLLRPSDFTGLYLYPKTENVLSSRYAGSKSISWFRGCSVECGVFGLKNVRHRTAAS